MGGISLGTMYSRTKPGEFNVFTDPEAARIRAPFRHPQHWIGLDCMLRARLTMTNAKELKQFLSRFASFAGNVTNVYIDTKLYLFQADQKQTPPPMHDPLVVAAVPKLELCEYKDVAVSVLIGDSKARGVMNADDWRRNRHQNRTTKSLSTLMATRFDLPSCHHFKHCSHSFTHYFMDINRQGYDEVNLLLSTSSSVYIVTIYP
jgi:inosine-uridine nucleoside N-ribohydrolase